MRLTLDDPVFSHYRQNQSTRVNYTLRSLVQTGRREPHVGFEASSRSNWAASDGGNNHGVTRFADAELSKVSDGTPRVRSRDGRQRRRCSAPPRRMIHRELMLIHLLVLLSDAVMVFSCLQMSLSEGEARIIPFISLVQSTRISKYMNKLRRLFSVVQTFPIPL